MGSSLEELLDRLQACDECQRIEAKEARAGLGPSVLETFSAFSNEPDLGGGYLLLGLKKEKNNPPEKRYSVIGVDNPDQMQCDIASVCRNAFNTQIRPKINAELIDGKVLIIVFIPEAFCREKPIFIKKYGEEKGTYRRIGSSDQKCSDMRALVFVREVGAITNQDYRQINGTHTLAASTALRHLRDSGLLTMKGSGNETYYQLVPQITGHGEKDGTPYISSLAEGPSLYGNPLYKGLEALPKGFPNLPPELESKITNLKQRASVKELEDIIIGLCSLGHLQPVQIAKILKRDAQYLRNSFLTTLVKEGRLTYRYPDKTAHPQQAYKAPEIKGDKADMPKED